MSQRYCSEGHWAPEVDFGKRGDDSFQYICKPCTREMSKRRRLERVNKDKKLILRVEFTKDEWRHILAEKGDKMARKFMVATAKQSILNEVYSL